MNVSKIKEKGKCMACGGCSLVCPVDAIVMTYSEKVGLYHPVIEKNKCVQCKKCIYVCPAVSVSKSSTLIGDFRNIFLAHSSDADVRHYATSGGVINSLARYLVDHDLVDAVVMVREDSMSRVGTGTVYVTRSNVNLLRSEARTYASRYVTYPVLADLKMNKSFKRLAVVGTPCQIKSLTKFGWGDNSIVDIFKIGITCSGGISYKMTEEYKRIKKLSSAKMYYRGDGWPGKNTLLCNDDELSYSHLDSLFERMFSSQIFKNPGCRNCIDHFAEESDISFCDYWNADEIRVEKEGNSCVIIRTEKAEDIFRKMQSNNYINIVKELSDDNVITTQMQVLRAKKGDMHQFAHYKVFIKFIDCIFKYRLYKMFGLRIYQYICTYYQKICNLSNL